MPGFLPNIAWPSLAEVGRVIFSEHDYQLLSLSQHVRDIRVKTRMAAFVTCNQTPVYPNGGAVVDRFEMQDRALAIPEVDTEPPRVPDSRMRAAVADAGEIRFRREWHLNSAAEVA